MRILRGLVTLFVFFVFMFGVEQLITTPLKTREEQSLREISSLSLEIETFEKRIATFENEKAVTSESKDLFIVAPDILSAELELQTSVLNIATNLGLMPNSFGPSIVALETGLQTVAFELEFEAGYQDTLEFITAVERENPRIAIETLWIRQIPLSSMPEDETPVSVRLSLWQYWLANTKEN